MYTQIAPHIDELIKSVHYRPAVSIIMPFEPKMNSKAELAQQLKFAMDKVKREIRANYNDELADLVLSKLHSIVQNINFSTYKKSIAIFVSPVFEKLLYLDIPVEEKIIIDESFEIRDLVFAKKQIQDFLLVVLSAKCSKVYLGDASHFTLIKFDAAEHLVNLKNNDPERVSNFADPSQRKEIQLKKFLQYADDGLRFLLRAYPLPVFVMGTHKVLGYFNALSRNGKIIVDNIHGNFTEASEAELVKIIRSHVQDFKKIEMAGLLQKIEHAADAGKLAIGIKEVWKQVAHHRGRLLVIEKNFRIPAEHGALTDEIFELKEPYNDFSYIRDAVDDMIEKVLEGGGDVEFVEDGMLSDYGQIALIQFY